MLAPDIERLVERQAGDGSVAQAFAEYLDAIARWPAVSLRQGFTRRDGPAGIQIISGDASIGWAHPHRHELQLLHDDPVSLVPDFSDSVSAGDRMVFMSLRELRDVNEALRLSVRCLEDSGRPLPETLGLLEDLEGTDGGPRPEGVESERRGFVSAKTYLNRRGSRRVTITMDVEEARRAALGDVRALREALVSAGVMEGDAGASAPTPRPTDVDNIATRLASIFDASVPRNPRTSSD